MIRLPRNEGLNIVPFIDIMLVLLAIVLSISTFIAYGHIKVEPPKAENANAVNDNQVKVLISIDEKDCFYIDDKQASFEAKIAINSAFQNFASLNFKDGAITKLNLKGKIMKNSASKGFL